MFPAISPRSGDRESLFWTGLVAVLLGLLISPPFARLLPFGLDGRVAPFILHADREPAWRRQSYLQPIVRGIIDRQIPCRRAVSHRQSIRRSFAGKQLWR